MRVDETRMQMPVGDVGDRDIWSSGLSECRSRVDDVLSILRAARIRAMRRTNETHGAADAVVRHRAQCVGEKRMPIAHPEIDRDVKAASSEMLTEPGDLTL